MAKPEYIVEKQPDGRYTIVDAIVNEIVTSDIDDLEMAEQECFLLNKEEDYSRTRGARGSPKS
jgi:hypothetical protein